MVLLERPPSPPPNSVRRELAPEWVWRSPVDVERVVVDESARGAAALRVSRSAPILPSLAHVQRHVYGFDKRDSTARDKMLEGMFDTGMPSKRPPSYIPPSRQARVAAEARNKVALELVRLRPGPAESLLHDPSTHDRSPPRLPGKSDAAQLGVGGTAAVPSPFSGSVKRMPLQRATSSRVHAHSERPASVCALPPLAAAPEPAPPPPPPPLSPIAAERVVRQRPLNRRLEAEAEAAAKEAEERRRRQTSRWRDAYARVLESGMVAKRGPKLSLLMVAKSAIENAHTMAALRELPVFSGLGETKLSMLATGGKHRAVPRYTAIYREDSEARSFFILKAGAVALSRSRDCADQTSATIRAAPGSVGTCFGLESLSGMVRQASAVALADVELLQFSMRNIGVGEGGAAAIAHKVFEHFLDGELAAMSLFEGIAATKLRAITHLFELEEMPTAGTPVFAEGAAGDAFFILLHGQVRVIKDGLTLAVLQAGSEAVAKQDRCPFFGEMALLDNKPRMASVVTASPSKLLKLDAKNFSQFMREVPDFAKRLKRIKDIRMAQTKINIRNRSSAPHLSHALGPAVKGVTAVSALVGERRLSRDEAARRRRSRKEARSPSPHAKALETAPEGGEEGGSSRGVTPEEGMASRRGSRAGSVIHCATTMQAAMRRRRASTILQQRRESMNAWGSTDGKPRRETLTATFEPVGMPSFEGDSKPAQIVEEEEEAAAAAEETAAAPDAAPAARRSTGPSMLGTTPGEGLPPVPAGAPTRDEDGMLVAPQAEVRIIGGRLSSRGAPLAEPETEQHRRIEAEMAEARKRIAEAAKAAGLEAAKAMAQAAQDAAAALLQEAEELWIEAEELAEEAAESTRLDEDERAAEAQQMAAADARAAAEAEAEAEAHEAAAAAATGAGAGADAPPRLPAD